MKKEKYNKACLGVDVGKDSLHVCLKFGGASHVSIKGTRKFRNTESEFKNILAYIKKRNSENIPLIVIAEATGSYYEKFAYFMRDNGIEVSIILPKQSLYFAKSCNIKTKTDLVDSKVLAQLGIEKFESLKPWTPLSPSMRQLRQLVRYRMQLVRQRSSVKQQIHANNYSYLPLEAVLSSQKEMVELVTEKIEAVEKLIKECVKSDADLEERIENVCTIKGVSMIVATTVVAETNGFALFSSIQQLVSYAGYDVVERSSGKTTGKSKISKKGNGRIRAVLHFAALVSVMNEPEMEQVFKRIYERNPKVKMIGYVAIQRRLLVLIYTLYRKNEPFICNYYQSQKTEKSRQEIHPTYAA